MDRKIKNPILTVAIPTRNRSRTLKKLLGQLQKEENKKFKILISDNDSSDNTEEIVRTYQKKNKNLEYFKNEKNLGSWGNIYNLYKLTKTRYLWLVSDDEEIIPGAIDKIIHALKKYNPSVVLFNHLKVDAFGTKAAEGVKKDTVFEDLKNFDDYRRLTRSVFMSIIVIEKRLPLSLIKEKYINDNYFFQVALILLTLSERFKFCEIAEPVVFRNTGYKSGEFFKFIMVDILETISNLEHKFDKTKFINFYKTQTIKALELYLSQKLGLFKFYGRPSLETIKGIFKYYGLQSIFILSFPLIKFLIPRFVLKFAYKTSLERVHGREKGFKIFKKNIDRAKRFNRVSGHID